MAVIGAGIGGYTAAIRSSQLGKKAAIIEKGEISRYEYVDYFEVSARTANYDLKHLENKGLIVQTGIGRAIKYVLPKQ